MHEIIRGDGWAGGFVKQGHLHVWERWDRREIKDGFIEFYPDEFFIPSQGDKLVLLLITPTFINLG